MKSLWKGYVIINVFLFSYKMSSRGRGRVSTQYSRAHKIQQFPWLHKVFRKFWRLNEKCKSCCCWAAFLTKSDWMLREFMEGDKAVSSDLWLHPCLFNPSNIFLHIYGNSIENISKLSVESNICWSHSKLCSLFYFPICFCFPFLSFCVHQQGGCLQRCIGSAQASRVHLPFFNVIYSVFFL